MSENHNNPEEEIKDQISDVTEESTPAEEVSEPTIEDKLQEANDKFVRLYAEFDNYRKRTSKEKVDMLSYASEGMIKEMLPILDDFERAITNNENVEDAIALKQGFQLIFSKFKSILEAKGLKQMEAKGAIFDSEVHEAIANVPSEPEMKNKVVDDVEKGYLLNDKVIRFAKVVVGQ